jgi:diguanylate cyclase (GGDEF)-like protein
MLALGLTIVGVAGAVLVLAGALIDHGGGDGIVRASQALPGSAVFAVLSDPLIRILVASFVLGAAAMAIVSLLVHGRAARASRALLDDAYAAAAIEPLTGLLNRSGFFVQVDHAMRAAIDRGLSVSLLYIDLDHFKELNDSYGHSAGDDLLRHAARELRATCGPDAIIGRIGGDEFAVCLSELVTMETAETTAASLRAALCTPCTLAGHGVVPSASIGYSMAPESADTVEDLARAADLALYAAKEAGRGVHRGFEHYMLLELDQRRELERLVREATAAERFEIHYQPLVNAVSGRLEGFEALLRLPTDERRFISPATFIPIAEEIGLISEIGRWVLQRACETALLWPDHLKLAVNLSPLQFKDFTIADSVRTVLRKTGIQPQRLQLEITEGLMLLKSEEIMSQLLVLKDLGVELAMDDFGSGYCSLSYLWKFPFDTIKIDRSFAQSMGDPQAPTGNVLASVLRVAQSLRLAITVEGIESEAQAAHVRALGCNTLQGFLFGPPADVRDLAAIIARDMANTVSMRLPTSLTRPGADRSVA